MIYRQYNCTDPNCGCSGPTAPCTSCTGTQNSASLVVTGSPPSGCPVISETLPWVAFTPQTQHCDYQWGGEGMSQYTLHMLFCETNSTWWAALFGPNDTVCFGSAGGALVTFCVTRNGNQLYWARQVNGVSCVGGQLTGSFTVPASSGGAVATVTL